MDLRWAFYNVIRFKSGNLIESCEPLPHRGGRSKKDNLDRHVNPSIHDNPRKTVLSRPFPYSVIPCVFLSKPYIS